MKNKSSQKAGDGASQYQADTLILHNGISEERVRAIVDERSDAMLKTCIYESRQIAERRVSDLKTELMGRFSERPALMGALQEPSCIDTLGRAIKTASNTDSFDDKALLASLLTERFENPDDRPKAAAINRAIEIVDSLSCEELTGLTVFCAIHHYAPMADYVEKGLKTLDEMFKELGTANLPYGNEWVDNLDILDALRVSAGSSLVPFHEYCYSRLNGYTVRGIKAGTEDDQNAANMLREANLPSDVLIDHELNPGYKRVAVANLAWIEQMTILSVKNGKTVIMPLSKQQTKVVEQVAEMTKGAGCEETIRESLNTMLKGFPHISQVIEWWGQIQYGPRLTVVGRALGSANARRINASYPDLIERM